MKIPTHLLTGVALFAAALSTSYGQSAVTSPVGYRTENIKQGYNLIGVNLAEKVEAAGVIDVVAGNVITDNDVDFTSLAGKDLLFKLTDGANAGALFQATQSGQRTITIDPPATTLPAVGGKYELRVTSTISSLFGAANTAGLRSGTDETSADAVYIPTGGGFLPVFYANAADAGSLGLTAGWYTSSFDPAGNVEIPYSLPVYIRNNRTGAPAAAAFDIVFVGHVVTNATKVTITTNATKYNYVSRILPVGMTTTQSNFQTSLASGTDEGSADAIYNPISPGVFEVYFYANAADAGSLGLAAGWYNSAFDPAGAKVLNSGFIIRRNSAGAAYALNVPIPSGLDL